MVSDSELVGRLREFLRTSDLTTTTTANVRRKLEEDFGIDLSNKKGFIREQVDLFLQSQLEKAEDDGDNDKERGEPEDEDEDQETKVKSEESDGSKEGYEEEEEDDDEKIDEDSNRKRTGKKGSNKSNKEVKKRGGGFHKLCSLSPNLQEFIGVSEMARTEVVKQLWIYIRAKNLQDPSNRRTIICDEMLRAVFGVDSINMFEMNKALSKHIWPLEADDAAPAKPTLKEKQQKQEREEESKPKEKRQKGGNSGFLAPLPLSGALVKFLGTGESALSRADVVKRMWDYIKQNNLQDPSDKRRIICDGKLKELFDVDFFNGFTVSKLLATHFVKNEQSLKPPYPHVA